MSKSADIIYEQEAAKAFNKQSAVFDSIYSNNFIIQYKRKRVRDHVEKFIKSPCKILELNAGTGEDAIYFAEQGHYVHATDISEGMRSVLEKKILSPLHVKIPGQLQVFEFHRYQILIVGLH